VARHLRQARAPVFPLPPTRAHLLPLLVLVFEEEDQRKPCSFCRRSRAPPPPDDETEAAVAPEPSPLHPLCPSALYSARSRVRELAGATVVAKWRQPPPRTTRRASSCCRCRRRARPRPRHGNRGERGRHRATPSGPCLAPLPCSPFLCLAPAQRTAASVAMLRPLCSPSLSLPPSLSSFLLCLAAMG
jgi:hypothetical protein